MRVSILITAACLSAACYNYQPLTTAAPEPGTYVMAVLTDSGSQELARHLGPNVSVVRGRYLGNSDAGLLVSVSSVEMKRGDQVAWAGETVTLPASDIAEVQVRRLAKGRSVLLVGVGVGGLVATTAAFALTGGGTLPGPGKEHPVPQ